MTQPEINHYPSTHLPPRPELPQKKKQWSWWLSIGIGVGLVLVLVAFGVVLY
jgi:hypothetical protein